MREKKPGKKQKREKEIKGYK